MGYLRTVAQPLANHMGRELVFQFRLPARSQVDHQLRPRRHTGRCQYARELCGKIARAQSVFLNHVSGSRNVSSPIRDGRQLRFKILPQLREDGRVQTSRTAVASIRTLSPLDLGNPESFRECDIIRADKVTAIASHAYNVNC